MYSQDRHLCPSSSYVFYNHFNKPGVAAFSSHQSKCMADYCCRILGNAQKSIQASSKHLCVCVDIPFQESLPNMVISQIVHWFFLFFFSSPKSMHAIWIIWKRAFTYYQQDMQARKTGLLTILTGTLNL